MASDSARHRGEESRATPPNKNGLVVDDSRKQHEKRDLRYPAEEAAKPVIFDGGGVETKRSEGLRENPEVRVLLIENGGGSGGRHTGPGQHVTVKRAVDGSDLQDELKQWNTTQIQAADSINVDISRRVHKSQLPNTNDQGIQRAGHVASTGMVADPDSSRADSEHSPTAMKAAITSYIRR